MTDIAPFSIGAELPRGRLAIEASAGTGKTYALAGLAARYIIEAEVPVGELLVVTFTRAAAAELRDRVRARLVDAVESLAADAAPDDEVLAALWDVPVDHRARRLQLAQRAVSDFDAATITTIHGFAQQVLGSLGTSVPTDPDAVLVDDTPALIAQVATDLLTAEAIVCRHPADDLPSHAKLVAAARLALGNPAAHLVPDADDPDVDADAALRRRLVDRIAREVDERRRASGSLSFDDLLVRLRDALDDPDRGPAARQALRRRYRIALIDEFQDTDPVQWAILDAVFGTGDHTTGDLARGDLTTGDQTRDDGPPPTLVLVGDPKQAIYAFRGADVHTYLDAAHAPGTVLSGLTTNWRSDADYLTALELLLEGATFGDDRIVFHHVDAAERNAATRIVDGNGDPLPTLALRLAAGNIARHSRRPKLVLTEAARDAVHHDLATYVRDLLEDARIPDRSTDDGSTRPLRPDDIAVLVATGAEGPEIRAALERVGVPAVIARGDNVLTSAAATQWHLLLSALARPADLRRARAVAVSWFVGWTGEELAAADDDAVADLHATLHRWADILASQGLATLLGTLRAETGVAARVLARTDGDRAMTDLDHVAELLQLAAPRRVSPAMLLATFEQLAGGDDEGDPEADLAARRVESESRAVQIMTTHVAKGLEFDVVCCPSLSHATPVKKTFVDPVRWDADGHRRVVDVAADVVWPDADAKAARTDEALAEAIGSNLRVLYVALTRARCHTAVWWAPTHGAAATGLARVLFARDADARIDPAAFTDTGAVATPDGPDAVAALAPLVSRSDGRLATTLVHRPDGRPRRWAGGTAPTGADLHVASLGRHLDRVAGRWSFTAITARAHEDHDVGIDPLDDTLGDGGDADELIPPDEAPDGLPTGVPTDEPATGSAAAHPGDRPATDDHGQLALAFDAPDATDPASIEFVGAAGGDVVVPLGDIAGGAGFGTLVHEVLERVDFTAPDLAAAFGDAVAERLAWNPWAVEVDQLVDGLVAVATTPLGPAFDGRPLADLAPGDRLDELHFDLTLGDGGGRATDRAIGTVLLEHLGADDPLRPWATHLASGPFAATLAGHLTGSIDLVARVRADGAADRFVVVDYKTNRIAAPGDPATIGLFRPDRLTAAMVAHHYPLQALLYEVALHRYLRWRLRGYDPAVHLGGIAYLFVRGMVGPDTPHLDGVPYGVWSWSPPVALVEALSDLLDGSLEIEPGTAGSEAAP